MKEKIIILAYRIFEIIMGQKILSALIGLTIVLLFSTLYISFTQVKVKNPSNNLSLNPKPIISEPVNSSGSARLLSPSVPTPSRKYIIPTSKPSSSSINPAAAKSPTPRPTQKISPTKKPAGLSPTIRPTSAPSSNSSSSNQNQQTSSNPTSTPVPNATLTPTPTPTPPPQIVFIGPGGEEQIYQPPTEPPVEITWARYTNQLEHYAIDYPSNWQIVTTQYRGHDAIFIYAPGADPGDPDVQYISYGWSTYFYPPVASYIGSFTLDGVPGTIYTNGSLGSTYIAGVFNYANGFLVLNNNVSDEIFAYIFNHMVLSLDFNTP